MQRWIHRTEIAEGFYEFRRKTSATELSLLAAPSELAHLTYLC